MGATVQMSGGFRGDTYPAWMSDGMVRRLARQEAEEARERVIEQRVTAELAERWTVRSQRAAAVLAEQRGEVVSARDAIRSWFGRTHAEAVQAMSDAADLEDAQQRIRLRRQFPGMTDDAIDQELSADVTPPSPEELARIGANRESARTIERARRRVRQHNRALTEHMRMTAREEILLDRWGYGP